MKQWWIMYRKELLEMWRNYKWVWVPLVFLFIGIQQPIASYYMPQIIDTLGGLPEGTVIQIPIPSAEQVIVEALSQFGMIGTLILVLASMGIVAGERINGTAALILVKPVSYPGYLMAKWSGLCTLTLVSFLLGMAGAWYYTEVLIGNVDPLRMLNSYLIYGFWFLFIVTITIFFSSLLQSLGGVAFLTILTVLLLAVLTSTFARYMEWSPGMLPKHASTMLLRGTVLPGFTWSVLVAMMLIFVFMITASAALQRKEWME